MTFRPAPNAMSTLPEELARFRAVLRDLDALAVRLSEGLANADSAPVLLPLPAHASTATRNDDRDAWLYNQCLDTNHTYKAIMYALGKLAPGKAWEPLGSERAVWQAARRYAKAHGQADPPARQAGRRRRIPPRTPQSWIIP